jgi:hypothetical protein
MPTARADAKKRVVLHPARPGDVFDVQSQGEDRIVLVRLAPPAPGPKLSRARCLQAIASAPLRMETTWESLRALTREP